MEQFGSHWTDFHYTWSRIFSKTCRENSSFIKIWQAWCLLYLETNILFCSYLSHFFSRREMFQTNLIKKIKTLLFIPSNPFPENHVVCEINRKNILQPDRPQATIWRMFVACWITKATNTHSDYVIPIAFPLQQWLHERALVLRYSYSAFHVITVCLLRGTRWIFKCRSG